MYNLITLSQINLRKEFKHHQNKESNCKKSHGVKIEAMNLHTPVNPL